MLNLKKYTSPPWFVSPNTPAAAQHVRVPYLSVCAMPTTRLTQSVCGSECAPPFYTLAPIGEGLWAEKQTCWGQRRETKETQHHQRGTDRGDGRRQRRTDRSWGTDWGPVTNRNTEISWWATLEVNNVPWIIIIQPYIVLSTHQSTNSKYKSVYSRFIAHSDMNYSIVATWMCDFKPLAFI